MGLHIYTQYSTYEVYRYIMKKELQGANCNPIVDSHSICAALNYHPLGWSCLGQHPPPPTHTNNKFTPSPPYTSLALSCVPVSVAGMVEWMEPVHTAKNVLVRSSYCKIYSTYTVNIYSKGNGTCQP